MREPRRARGILAQIRTASSMSIHHIRARGITTLVGIADEPGFG